MPRLLGLTGRLRASGNVGGARPRRGRSSYVLSVDHSKPCFENSPVLLALSLPDAGESYEHNCQAIHNGDRPDEGKPSPAPEVKSTAEPPLSPKAPPRRWWNSLLNGVPAIAASIREHPAPARLVADRKPSPVRRRPTRCSIPIRCTVLGTKPKGRAIRHLGAPC